MKYLIFLFLLSCGTESQDQGAIVEEAQDKKADTEETEAPISIAVVFKADLPECSEAKEAMLAYVKSEDAFYSCESNVWVALDIKGKDGKDGANGVTTTVEVEATNKLNHWEDPISGHYWYLGGAGTQSSAISACVGDYRLPTQAEGVEAINHGIRNVATDIGAVLPFWTDAQSVGMPIYATLVNGNANTVAVASNTANISIFCIKK
jgi:hypothetical protein